MAGFDRPKALLNFSLDTTMPSHGRPDNTPRGSAKWKPEHVELRSNYILESEAQQLGRTLNLADPIHSLRHRSDPVSELPRPRDHGFSY